MARTKSTRRHFAQPDPNNMAFRFGQAQEDQGNAMRGTGNPRPGDFTFRAQSDRPAPHFSAQPLPPQGRQHPTRRAAQHNNRFAPSRGGHSGPPRYGYTRKPKPNTSDRPLLQGQRQPTPEQMEGMNGANARFKKPEEMDSDSASMDTGTSSDESSDEPPRKKVHTTAATKPRRPTDIKPVSEVKWSNPDPYFVLPPVLEGGPRKDVVKLIRNAKIAQVNTETSAAQGDDFISFGDDNACKMPGDDDTMSGSSDEESIIFMHQSSTAKKFSHLDNLHPNRIKETQPPLPKEPPPPPPPGPPPPAAYIPPPPPPDMPYPDSLYENTFLEPDDSGMQSVDVWPPPVETQAMGQSVDVWPPPAPIPVKSAPQLKRKRGEFQSDGPGLIKPAWRPKAGKPATPWYNPSAVNLQENVLERLNKEIHTFYDYVRPTQAEDAIRHDLCKRLSTFVKQRFDGDDTYHFGSFAAGIYLPDADMDLVILSRQRNMSAGGNARQQKKNQTAIKKVYSMKQALVSGGIAKPGSAIGIPHAKVPIVKYVDQKTLLRVDVSFDNETGIVANETFQQWKYEHPALMPLLALLKHFLLMRGLNDNATGGLGGFATTCLVVSFLQLQVPQLLQRADPMRHLGQIFVSMLNFYGSSFDTTLYGIQFDPPAYFHKANHHFRQNPRRPWSLSIEDPNREDNDISGGSSEVRTVLAAFQDAYWTLSRRMDEIEKATDIDAKKQSVLASIFAGDYSSYVNTRHHLRKLHSDNPQLYNKMKPINR